MNYDRFEILPAGDSLLDQYEKLYIRKQTLEQESSQLRCRYMLLFGTLLIRRFSLEIRTVRQKKEIAAYIRIYNRGEIPDPQRIARDLNEKMADWYEMLRNLVRQEKAAQNAEPIPENDRLRIRQIFRSLVHQMHPDLHPELESDEEIKQLWNELLSAYHCMDLETMEEIQVQVLLRLKLKGENISLPSHCAVEERIRRLKEKIAVILETDPYRYREWIDDPDLVEEKKTELQEEISILNSYSQKLKQELEELIRSREELYA